MLILNSNDMGQLLAIVFDLLPNEKIRIKDWKVFEYEKHKNYFEIIDDVPISFDSTIVITSGKAKGNKIERWNYELLNGLYFYTQASNYKYKDFPTCKYESNEITISSKNKNGAELFRLAMPKQYQNIFHDTVAKILALQEQKKPPF